MIADAVGVPVANVVTFEVKIRLKTTQVRPEVTSEEAMIMMRLVQ